MQFSLICLKEVTCLEFYFVCFMTQFYVLYLCIPQRLNKLALMLVAICCLPATDCRPKCSSHDDCLKGFLSCWNKCSQIYCIDGCQDVLSQCLRCQPSKRNLSYHVHRVLKGQNEFNKQYP